MKKVMLGGFLAFTMAVNAQTGNMCGCTSIPLPGSWEIPMAGFTMNYTMPAASASQLSIGNTNCTAVTPARLEVNNDFHQIGFIANSVLTHTAAINAGRFFAQNLGTGNTTALVARVLSSNTAVNAVAINANSTGSLSYDNIGVNAPTANGSHASLGVNADISNSSSPINQGYNTEIFTSAATSLNYGASLTVSTVGNTNYGVYAYAAGGNFNAAVYGSTPITSTVTTGTDWAGYFNGSVYTSGVYLPSDQRLKKEVKSLDHSLELIKKLNPVTYSFDQESHKNINLATGKQFGFISQQVKEILPELATPFTVPAVLDKDGKEITPKEEFIGLNYQGFTAIMVDAIQQQQEMIEAQQKQIDELKSMVQALAAATPTNGTKNTQAVNLGDNNRIVLDQNVPNPFAESTVITYTLPAGFAKAQIVFSAMDGKAIKTIDLHEKGRGTLNVFASDLSTGLYSYSLIVDGKVIETKKMVKE